MSSRTGSKLALSVKARPIPRLLVRAQVAGEVVAACGGSERSIETAQKGVALHIIKSVIVYGLNGDGQAIEKIELTFDAERDGDIMLDLSNGRSAVEALDPALARAVAYQSERIKTLGLTPRVQFRYHDHIAEDADRDQEADRLLGLTSASAPPTRPGHHNREVLRVRPGKDSGTLASFYQEFGDD